MINKENKVPIDPLVDLILRLAQKKQGQVLNQIRNLIYQPFQLRYHPILFSILPDKETGITFYSLRQAYRLIGPLMASYPRTTDTGNFGRSLGELEWTIGQATIEHKLLIITQSSRLYWAESTLLRLVTLMKDRGILINWNQLLIDTRYWNENTLNRWYEALVSARQRKKNLI
jgi:hypothetical protein